MRRLCIALLISVLATTGSSLADDSLNTGLFLNIPDISDEHSNKSFNLKADGQDENYSAGLAIRSGSLFLGFETRKSDPFSDYDGPSAGLENMAGLHTQSAVLNSQVYRVTLGMMLGADTAIFGFNGVSNQSVRRSVSYENQSEHFIERYKYVEEGYESSECPQGYCVKYWEAYDDTYAVNSFGSSFSQGKDVGIVLGTGFEHRLLGGALRFEYSMTYYPETTQSFSYEKTSAETTAEGLGTHYETITWDEVFEHTLNMRWKSSF